MEPWLARLADGDGQAAWDLFAERYRRLMLATIRRLVHDHDDVMDVFSDVCAALTVDNFARLRRYSERSPSGAAVSTWLVVVVRNLVVDWLRRTDGRRRITIPSNLSALHREIYVALCLDGHTPVEAFELVRDRTGVTMSFAEFLREVRATRQSNPCPGSPPIRRLEELPPSPTIAVPISDPAEISDLARRLATTLATQPDDVRLAVQLFVIDELPAAQVASIVGWPNAKAVYNRVHRALAALRATLEAEGVGRGDL